MANAKTLAELAALLGTPDEKRRAALFTAVTEADLVESGTRTATARILNDAASFFDAAHTIYLSLSPEKQKLLVGFSPALLPIGVDEAIKLQSLHERQRETAQTGGADKAGAVANLASRRREALTLRDVALRAIRPYVPSGEMRARLAALRGTAQTPQELADGLRGVANTLEEVRGASTAEVTEHLDEVGLGAAYVQKLNQAAESLLEAQRAVSGASAERLVAQRECDLQDGRVLHIIGIVLRSFQAGQEQDETILVPPLRKLARLFKGHRTASAEPSPAPAADAPITD